MGEKQCAFEGCKALEFRTTNYCLRHKGGLSDKRKPNITGDSLNELEGKVGIEVLLFFIGIIISLFGYSLLQAEPVSHWFEGLINPIVQICGLISLVVGVLFILSPIFAKYGYRIDNSSASEMLFDPSTGMYYLPVDKEISEDKQTSEK
jgi:hypothetical protein